MTLRHTNHVYAFIHIKYTGDRNLLLKVFPGPLHLVGCATSVQLDLHNMSLLLHFTQNLHLCVSNNSDDTAVLLDLTQISLNLLLAQGIGPLGGVLGESLLLASRPILVESSLTFLSNMLSPHCLEGSQSTRGVDIPHYTNNHNRWSFEDGHSFSHLFLVTLGAWTIHLSDDVGHTSLVAHEGSKMNWFGGIIFRPAFDTTSIGFGSLLGQETLGPVTGGLKLSVRHDIITG